MPDHGPLLVGDLIERSHPLNRGRVAWWLAIPHLSGSTLWYDPVGRNPAALLDLSTSNGWRSTSRPGGFGEVSFANTLGALSADTLRHGIGTGDFTIAAW